MKESTTLNYSIPIRDDSVVGALLNDKFEDHYCDYTQAQCYYLGNYDLCWCLNDYRELDDGMQAEMTIASFNSKFPLTKGRIKTILATFFENKYYNNVRLIALVQINNKQAIRLLRLSGFTEEGRLRKIYKGKDALLFSILKEEYES